MTVTSQSSPEAFDERLLGALAGAAELLTVELGRELGLYRALRGRALTAGELAETAGIDARNAREWLEQQARIGADETAALVDAAALTASRLYAAEAARLDRARTAVAERLGPGRPAELRRRGERLGPASVTDEALAAIDSALKRLAG
jgi:hypothetical protein